MAGPDRLLVWSPEARAHLSDIWTYYAQVAGPRTADSIVRKIGDASRLLEDQPYSGRPRAEIRPGLRSVGANPYVISTASAQGILLRSFASSTVDAISTRFLLMKAATSEAYLCINWGR